MSAPVAFITGGASGLGRALARRFAQDGYRVLVGDLKSTSQATKEELFAEVRDVTTVEDKDESVAFISCDVRSSEDLIAAREAAVDRWDRVDVVANNAGVGGGAKFIEDCTEEQDWDYVMDINCMGVVRGCTTFMPLFRRQKSGHFINIASAAGLFNAAAMGPYSCSKAAVVSISETLRFELANQPNIGVSVVTPSFFPTNIVNSMHGGKGTIPGLDKFPKKAMATAKVSADDVAQMCKDAVDNKTFLVIPTSDVIWQHRMKRFFPDMMYKNMEKMGRKVGARWEQMKKSESQLDN